MHLLSLFSLNLPLYEHKKRPSYGNNFSTNFNEKFMKNFSYIIIAILAVLWLQVRHKLSLFDNIFANSTYSILLKKIVYQTISQKYCYDYGWKTKQKKKRFFCQESCSLYSHSCDTVLYRTSQYDQEMQQSQITGQRMASWGRDIMTQTKIRIQNSNTTSSLSLSLSLSAKCLKS